MNKSILLVLLCAFFMMAEAKIYKQVDDQGRVSFSDAPSEGSTEVKLSKPQTVSIPQNKFISPLHKKSKDHAFPAIDDNSQISINQPKDKQTFQNSDGNITLTLALDPPLSNGRSIQLLMDGNVLGEPQQRTTIPLTHVERGTHTLQAKLLNSDKVVIAASNTITFYVHRPKI